MADDPCVAIGSGFKTSERRHFPESERKALLESNFNIHIVAEVETLRSAVQPVCHTASPGEQVALSVRAVHKVLQVSRQDGSIDSDAAEFDVDFFRMERERILTPRRPLPGSTSSESTIAQLKSWMRTCSPDFHIGCNNVKGAKQPTRLLHAENIANNTLISLVDLDTSDVLSSAYLTLSHQWGGSLPFMLTASTEARLRAGIQPTELPQLFYDACTLTSRLGYEFLWIDALCIFQDNKDDWASESALMDGIYAGAALNIAASDAKDTNDSLFQSYHPLSAVPCVVSTYNSTKYRWTLEMEAETPSLLEKRPLYQRAWVLQERLLSPRTVHFTDHQVIWECCEQWWPETDPSGLSRPWKSSRRGMKRDLRQGAEHNSHDNPYYDGRLQTWSKVVAQYSGMKLTYGSDRLIAIQGVANRLMNDLSEYGVPSGLPQYLAGLWAVNFAYNLAWRVQEPHASHRPPERYCPSWSWASVDGSVKLFETSMLFKNFLYSSLPEARFTGNIQSIVMTTTTRLRRCKARVEEESEGVDIQLEVNGLSCSRLYVNWDEVSPQSARKHADAELYLFPLFSPRSRKTGRDSEDGDFAALILEFVNGTVGQYRRVGLYSLWVPSTMEPDHYREIRRNRREQELPSSRYLDYDAEAGKYSIEII